MIDMNNNIHIEYSIELKLSSFTFYSSFGKRFAAIFYAFKNSWLRCFALIFSDQQH